MSSNQVAIVSVGMMTSVGLSAMETAASVRAATMRFTQTEWRDHRFEPFTLAEVLEDGLPDLAESIAEQADLTYREARLLRLGSGALAGCLKLIVPQIGKLGLELALPEHETTKPLDPLRILRLLYQQTDQAFDAISSNAGWRGRAGGLMAINQAGRMIRDGRAKFILAGGIDSYRDLFILRRLDMEKRVKSETNLDGFIPGEGACFLLLASRDAAERAGLKIMALVSQVSDAMEAGHLQNREAFRGDGLSEAFNRFFTQHASKDPMREVYSPMNGESYWGKEWGVAFIRNKAAFDPGHGMHHPADCFGDTGAASGPLLTGLAACGITQGYRQSPCLIYTSSDSGARAVLAVSTSEKR